MLDEVCLKFFFIIIVVFDYYCKIKIGENEGNVLHLLWEVLEI